MKERDDDSQRLSYGTPQLFSYEELKSFTSNLKKNVGFGGFGDVYKGKFPNGVKIAVKVLKENTKDVMIKQFMAEVSTMGSISHPNLIKLYGYCFDIDMQALVYEYMKFGSLDKILFKHHVDIEWEKLYNIAVEIADGLSFLHEECRPRIIHYDIKPDNVLIDSNYSPKIVDFGMARHSSQAKQSGYRGTNSYAAPEVGKGRLVTYKSDVYSFGMMLFEILRKKRNSVGPGWFPGEVAIKVENDELDEIILVCGIEEKNKEKAEKLSLVALWCTQEKHFQRPDMSSVVKMLRGEMRLEKPPNPFGFYDDSPESNVVRPLPKFSPAIIEGSLGRAEDSTRITSVHSGSSSTSRPPSKIIPNDLKRESIKIDSGNSHPGQNASLQKDDARSSGTSSPESTGSVETSISSHFGGKSYPSLHSSKPSNYGAPQSSERSGAAASRFSNPVGASSTFEGVGLRIREEPPSYEASVMQRFESFENPMAGSGARSFGSRDDEEPPLSENPQCAKALYDFTAGGDDEVNLAAGEEVEIDYEVDGWFYVKKKRPGRDGKLVGLVPVLYVTM